MTNVLTHPQPEIEGGRVRAILSMLAVCLFFTNLDSFMFAYGAGPPPVRFVFAFIGIAALLTVIEPTRPFEILRSPFGLWLFAYFFVTTMWAPWIKSEPQLVQELVDRYRSIACIFAFAIVFDHPRARRAALYTVAAAVAFAAVVNLLEATSLIEFPVTAAAEAERVAGRAAGVYFNPNTSGLAIVMGLAVSIEAIRKSLRVPLLLLAGFGVAATYSRGAMICLVALFLWLVWRRALGAGQLVVLLVAMMLLASYALAYLHAHDLLNENTASRLQLAKDDSGRVELLQQAWALFASHPWLGNGLGSTIDWDQPVRAHNMYLTLAADHGLVGLVMYPALAFSLVRTHRHAGGLALALLAAGLFSHAVLEDRYSLLIVALAATGGVVTKNRGVVEEVLLRPQVARS